jgi:hypothetical protein
MPTMFPANPTVGQTSKVGSRTYQWSGVAWKVYTGDASVTANSVTAGDTVKAPTVTANNVTAGDTVKAPTVTANNVNAGDTVRAPTVTANNVNAGDTVRAPTITSNTVTASESVTAPEVKSNTVTASESVTAPVVNANVITSNTINADNVNYSNGQPRTIGTVSYVDVLGGNTGLVTSGGPITTVGNITLSGILSIEHGGTGSNTANAAISSLLPDQTGNSGKFLKTTTNGLQWATATGGSAVPEPSYVQYFYDDEQRAISVDETIDGEHRISTYTYNSNSTVATVTTSFQGVTRVETYDYDSNGLVTSMTATYP